MELKEQIESEIAAVIGDCIRKDYSFNSYAGAVSKVVIELVRPIIEERDKLRAEIEAMKNQEPACWVPLYRTGEIVRWFGDGKLVPISLDEESALEVKRLHLGIEKVVPLYLAPGAQPELCVPDGVIERGIAELENIRNRLDDTTLINDRTLVERLYAAMTAAPKTKL